MSKFNEPWHTNHLPTDIWDASGAHICDTAILHITDHHEEYKAIAARIVACVNACAGISNVMLANGVTPKKAIDSPAAFRLKVYYNIDVSAARGDTWQACSEMYLHDICVSQEAYHA